MTSARRAGRRVCSRSGETSLGRTTRTASVDPGVSRAPTAYSGDVDGLADADLPGDVADRRDPAGRKHVAFSELLLRDLGRWSTLPPTSPKYPGAVTFELGLGKRRSCPQGSFKVREPLVGLLERGLLAGVDGAAGQFPAVPVLAPDHRNPAAAGPIRH